MKIALPAPRILLLAALSLAAVTPAARADLLYTPVNGGSGFMLAAGDSALYFNIETGQYSPYGVPNAQFMIEFSAHNLSMPLLGPSSGNSSVAGGGLYVDKLAADSPIDENMVFGNAGILRLVGLGQWQPVSDAYAGLRLGELSEDYKYGWAHLIVNEASVTLLSFAVQTDGTPITAGATSVPEPAAAAALGGLLAGSAAACAARRKRRAQQAG